MARVGDLVCVRRMGIPILVEVTQIISETPYNTGYLGRVIGSEVVPYDVEFLHSDLVPCPGTNMEPILQDVPAIDVTEFAARERDRRLRLRGHLAPTPSYLQYRARDMEILYRVLSNMLLLRLRALHNDDQVESDAPDLSWCIRMDTLMLRVDPTVYEQLKQRLNREILQGTGFELLFVGVDPTMGDEYIGFILAETVLS